MKYTELKANKWYKFYPYSGYKDENKDKAFWFMKCRKDGTWESSMYISQNTLREGCKFIDCIGNFNGHYDFTEANPVEINQYLPDNHKLIVPTIEEFPIY